MESSSINVVQYDGCLHEVTKWAINRRNVGYEPPTEFLEFIHQLMPEKCRDIVGYHLNFYTPMTPTDESGEWVRGYPHSHVWSVDWPPEAFTCLTYLSVADEGGEFALGGLERDEPYTFVEPQPGQTFMFDAMRWHGVRPVKKGVRLSLLTSGVPDQTNAG